MSQVLKSNHNLTFEDINLILKVDNHIKSKKMSLVEKLQSAKLIALHDLELGHGSPEEAFKAKQFTERVDSILAKMK